MEAKAPKDSPWFVTGMFFKILLGAGIQQVDQPRVTGLVEIVNDFANEKVKIEFSSQVAQFPSRLALQNSLADADGPAQACDDATNGGYSHVTSRIAHQINIPASQVPTYGDPL